MQKAKLITIGILLLIVILIPVFIQSPYIIHLLIMMGLNIILALTFLMLLNTGLLSLGAATWYCVGAYTSTLLVMNLGMNFWLAILISALFSGIVALLFGSIMVKMAGMIFAILTMVVNTIISLVVAKIPFCGGWGGILCIPPPDPITIPFLPPIEFTTKMPFYYLLVAILLLTCIVFYGLYNSRIGRNWIAIKQTPALAESVGINLYRYRLLAYVIAAIFCGLAGSFYAHYFQSIAPDSFGVFKSVYVQLYAVLGGIEYLILGPILGSVVWTIIPTVLSDFKEYVPLISGFILIILVIYFRGGLMSLPSVISDWMKRSTRFSRFFNTKSTPQ
jgi:branched-chain amino acid transport system permease protein